jgi:lysozyme family protein
VRSRRRDLIGHRQSRKPKRICAKRLGFMQPLNIWKTFGHGWARRLADIEAKGVAWALTAANDNQAVVKQQLEEEAGKARLQARKTDGYLGRQAAAQTGPTTSLSSALYQVVEELRRQIAKLSAVANVTHAR